MKSWKKIAVISTAFVTAAALVAGTGTKASAASKQTLTIGYWKGSDTENATFDKLVKAFEAKYNVDVKPKVYTDITQQLPTDLSGGAATAPDVFYVDSSFYPYLKQEDVLADLSKVVTPSNFYSTSIKAFQTSGKTYAVPKDVSTLAIYVNKDIFTKAGIDINSIPKSYEDFKTWAPAQQKKLDATYGAGKVYLMNMNADLTRNWQFITSGSQNPITSKGQSNLSNSKIVKNLTFVQSLFNEGVVATPQQVGASDEGAGFGTGKFAMSLTGNWNYQVFNTQYKGLNYTVIPNMTYAGKKQTMQYTVGWAEYKDTKVSTVANNWIKYVTGKDGMMTWTSGVGTLATRSDVNNSSAFIKANPLLKVHSDELSYAAPWQDGVNLTTVVTSYGNFITDAFKKDANAATLKKILKEVDTDANSKIEK